MYNNNNDNKLQKYLSKMEITLVSHIINFSDESIVLQFNNIVDLVFYINDTYEYINMNKNCIKVTYKLCKVVVYDALIE